ncbi:ATP-dependent zinc metalloprotease FtsH [Candidatus Dojkabacteria bacterium]|nr:ATP-dependent zinc metalloprotease FtsH [Candidatus Dojkabacteria bacterium]
MIYAKEKEGDISRNHVTWKGFTDDFTKFLQEEGVDFSAGNVEIRSVYNPPISFDAILTIAGILALVFAISMLARAMQGQGSGLMQFGQSKARLFWGKKPEITFKDVAGVKEAKEELKEVVMFLKKPKKFMKLGARIPKGMLMVGPPGTGKTLLAKAIAGEAGVPFFHTSGAEFEEMLVGAGASRVRDLFNKAKRSAPALIFIDEIDAIARKRGTTVQSGHTEQTLNQILVEMDGFETNQNVIVIAATNRPDVLDPAILRPGRFDRRIVLDLPDIEGREKILKIHAKNKPLAADVKLADVAKRTVGFSGADLENMLNEAAIITAKDNRKEITRSDIEEAATKVVAGPERRRKRTDEELKMTAYHEAGHAIVAKMTPKTDPVHRITIVSRGMALGWTMQLPQEDKYQQSMNELIGRIKVLMGGRAAEEIIFGDVTSGASNDIEKATSIARKMVKQFGMSKKLGLVKYGQSNELQYLGYGYGEQKDYSEQIAEEIDMEVKGIINEAYEDAKEILTGNKETLDKLSEMLLENEVVESEEFEKLFGNSDQKGQDEEQGSEST